MHLRKSASEWIILPAEHPRRDADPGAVHHPVEPAIPLDDVADQHLDLRLVANVGLPIQHPRNGLGRTGCQVGDADRRYPAHAGRQRWRPRARRRRR